MAVAVALGYLLGSIPFAWLVVRRWRAIDLRRAGSGNLGAANVARTAGLAAGLLVAVLDIAKGAASVVIADRLTHDSAAAAAAGVAAVVGHVYPIWLRFQGGKGAATGCGVFAVLGAGSWGTALAVHLTRVGHRVKLWARDPELAADLAARRANPVYLPDVTLPPGVEVAALAADAVAGAEVIVLAIPSHGCRG